MPKLKKNRFAVPEPEEAGRTDDVAVQEAPEQQNAPVSGAGKTQPSRQDKKHVGGYYDKAVHRQVKMISALETISVEDLVAEALDMLFHSRQMPTIAKKPTVS